MVKSVTTYPQNRRAQKQATGKNVALTDENKIVHPPYKPDEKEQEVISAIFFKFRTSADQRNKNYEYFDGLGLIDYIDDSVRRFVTNIDERDDMEDWQARVHDPFTRNKVLTILGKVVQVLPIAQVQGRGDEDIRKGILLSNLYEYAEEIDDYEELMINILMECIVKGTAIGYEGLERKSKQVKNIKGYNDEIKYETQTITTTRLFGAIVKLEDFYPSNVSIRKIKDMPYCFWRTVLPYQTFLQDWGMYAQAKNVVPKSASTSLAVQEPFYVDYISQNVPEGSVELIRYYNQDTDEYVIMANGCWLNPIMVTAGKEISPMPFDHKTLPFWEIKFDLFGPDFFYGKSLPDRLKSLQDVLNVLTNMLLDQSFLTIFPPMLTAGFDPIEDDYIRPGRRTPVDTQGLPLNQAFMKLDLGVPQGWHQYILEYTRKIMEQSSMDQLQSGQAGVGGRTTAQEVRVAADGVTSMLGVFARLINYGVKRKAMLKVANILQFWTDKNSPILTQVGGEGATQDFNSVFNTFKVDNTILTSGVRGTKIIELYGDKAKMPTKKQLQTRSTLSRLSTGRKVEYVAIDPDYIRDFAFDIKLGINQKTETSKEMGKALQLEKVRVYLSFFPDLINKSELAAETALAMGDDPTKILLPDAFQNAQDVPNNGTAQPEGAGKPVPGKSSSSPANNMVRSQGGGDMGGATNQMKNINDLQALQSSMLG